MYRRSAAPAGLSRRDGALPASGAVERAIPGPAAGVWIHPRFQRLPPPIIIIGGHRCGTSLVAAMLASLNIYLGPGLGPGGRPAADYALDESWQRNGYGEEEAFRGLNDRLLLSAGGAWDRPEPFLARLEQPLFAARSCLLLQTATCGHLRTGFLRSLPAREPGVWGWKDPRNSLTLPFWLRLFPHARVIHVRRDPEAAADSLYRRAQAGSAVPPQERTPGSRFRWALSHPAQALSCVARRAVLARRDAAPDPCLDPDFCLRLSHQYADACFRLRTRSDQWLEIRYEQVLCDPESAARELARFSGGWQTEVDLHCAAGLVRRRS